MRISRFLRLGAGASHGHGHGAGASKEYGGFQAPHVDPKYETIATFMGTVMWFWIFYRAKEDGAALIGLVKPWEAHAHHGHDEHHAEEGHAEPKLH